MTPGLRFKWLDCRVKLAERGWVALWDTGVAGLMDRVKTLAGDGWIVCIWEAEARSCLYAATLSLTNRKKERKLPSHKLKHETMSFARNGNN